MPIPDFAHGIQISFLDTANRARMKGHGTPIASTANPGTSAPASATGSSSTDGTQTASSSSMPFSFDDFVDVINPLQHLPIISTLYEHYANDPINTFPKIAGDTLYGGPLGLLSSVADTAFEKITGKSFGDTALAWVTGDKSPAAGTAVASTAKPATVATASIASPAVAHVANSKTVPFATPTKVAAAGTPKSLTAASASQMPNLDPASFNALSAFMHDKGIDGDTTQRTLDAYRKTMQLGTELPPSPQAFH